MKKIYCIGGAAVDFRLIAVKPLINKTSNPVVTRITFGGVAHNVAKNLAYLTSNICLQSVVGNDENGKLFFDHMRSLNVDVKSCRILENHKTASYYAVLNNNGELHIALADMKIFESIILEDFTHTWSQWEENSIIFVDTNLPSVIVQHVIILCKKQNYLLCIDPVSVSKTKVLPASLAGIFLIKPDQYEAEAIANIAINNVSDALKAGKIIFDKGVHNVIITLGKNGYVIVNEYYQQHFSVKEINTMMDVSGAGDAFVAGVLSQLQQNAEIISACKMGEAVAFNAIKNNNPVN